VEEKAHQVHLERNQHSESTSFGMSPPTARFSFYIISVIRLSKFYKSILECLTRLPAPLATS
jgi:hypothetical protein